MLTYFNINVKLTSSLLTKQVNQGGSPGLMVMGGDSHSKGRGFESRHRILDGHFFTYICHVCLKKTKNKQKRGRGWPIFF